jgi:tetratricopeptide (TPR) repeat protein
MRPVGIVVIAILGSWTQALMAQSAAQPQAWEKAMAEQRWADAEPLLKLQLAQGESAPALRALATVYRVTGRLPESDPLLEKLAAMEGTVENLEDLAGVKVALAQWDRAEQLYRRSLELRAQNKEDEVKSIPARRRLAEVLMALSKFSDAESGAKTAVSIRTATPGAAPSDLAGDIAVLAGVYEAQKKFKEAAGEWERVIHVQETALGLEDLKLAPALDSLATCWRELEQWPQAEAPLRRELAIREVNQGPFHAEVAQTIDTLAQVLFVTKQFVEAELLYGRSLQIWGRLVGLDNPLLARSYDNLAVTKASLEKYAEAEKFYAEALRLRDGEDAASLHNLALARMAQEKFADAEPLLKRVVAMLDEPPNRTRQQLDPEFVDKALADYAEVLQQLKRPVEAAKMEARRKALKQPAPAPRRPTSAAAKQ